MKEFVPLFLLFDIGQDTSFPLVHCGFRNSFCRPFPLVLKVEGFQLADFAGHVGGGGDQAVADSLGDKGVDSPPTQGACRDEKQIQTTLLSALSVFLNKDLHELSAILCEVGGREGVGFESCHHKS